MVIQVGSVLIQDHVLLAPMSGVTDIPYRATLKSLGADVTISEMVAGRAIINDEDTEIRKIGKIDDRTIVQIAGFEPQVMAEAAKRCEANGALMIDINFGCPSKKVVNKFAGSAIMQDEYLARSIMHAIAQAVAIPGRRLAARAHGKERRPHRLVSGPTPRTSTRRRGGALEEANPLKQEDALKQEEFDKDHPDLKDHPERVYQWMRKRRQIEQRERRHTVAHPFHDGTNGHDGAKELCHSTQWVKAEAHLFGIVKKKTSRSN